MNCRELRNPELPHDSSLQTTRSSWRTELRNSMELEQLLRNCYSGTVTAGNSGTPNSRTTGPQQQTISPPLVSNSFVAAAAAAAAAAPKTRILKVAGLPERFLEE